MLQTGLGLTVQPRLAFSSQQSSCYSLPRAGTAGMCHQARLFFIFSKTVEARVRLNPVSAIPAASMSYRGGGLGLVCGRNKNTFPCRLVTIWCDCPAQCLASAGIQSCKQ